MKILNVGSVMQYLDKMSSLMWFSTNIVISTLHNTSTCSWALYWLFLLPSESLDTVTKTVSANQSSWWKRWGEADLNLGPPVYGPNILPQGQDTSLGFLLLMLFIHVSALEIVSMYQDMIMHTTLTLLFCWTGHWAEGRSQATFEEAGSPVCLLLWIGKLVSMNLFFTGAP